MGPLWTSTPQTRAVGALELREDVFLDPNMRLKGGPAKIEEVALVGGVVQREEAVQSGELALIGEKGKRGC